MGDSLAGWIHGHFESWDKTKMFYRFYPNPKARHTVLILHGFGEHSGRYEKFPERMPGLAAQWAVMDLRGMGASGGARGDVRSFEDYLKDMDAFIVHLRQKFAAPEKFILFGHSLGGLVAVHWGMRRPECIKTLVLSVPFLGFRGQAFLRPLNCLTRFFFPECVYKNPIFPKVLSHDTAEIALYRKDPLILRHISVRLVGELMRRIEILQKLPAVSFPFPVTFLAAGNERVVEPKAARRFFERLAASRKEFICFEGFYHEIFNEVEQQKAFNVLKTIIEDCV